MRGRETAVAGRVSAQYTHCSTEETPLEGMLELILFVSAMVSQDRRDMLAPLPHCCVIPPQTVLSKALGDSGPR